MAGKKSVKKRSFDSKALSEELGATVKEGSVVVGRGKYYLKVGTARLEIPVGGNVAAGSLQKLVGSSVPVVVSGRTIIAIGNLRGPGCYMILCYKPAPGFVKEIDESVRAQVIDKYVSTGALTKAFGGQLKGLTGAAVALD